MRASRKGRPGQQTEQFLQSPGAGQSQFDPSSRVGTGRQLGTQLEFGSSNGAFAGSSSQEVTLEREGSRTGRTCRVLHPPAPAGVVITTQVMRMGSPRPPAAQGQPRAARGTGAAQQLAHSALPAVPYLGLVGMELPTQPALSGTSQVPWEGSRALSLPPASPAPGEVGMVLGQGKQEPGEALG